jgi:hypothetical protein
MTVGMRWRDGRPIRRVARGSIWRWWSGRCRAGRHEAQARARNIVRRKGSCTETGRKDRPASGRKLIADGIEPLVENKRRALRATERIFYHRSRSAQNRLTAADWGDGIIPPPRPRGRGSNGQAGEAGAELYAAPKLKITSFPLAKKA